MVKPVSLWPQTGYNRHMNLDIGYIVTVLAVVLVSMTLHEAMHAFMSHWLGDRTAKDQGRLTLNPIKHIDPFLTILLPLGLALVGAPVFGGARPVPFDPSRVRHGEWGVALVALAGPLTNLLLAFVAFAGYVWLGALAAPLASVLMIMVLVNLGFFVFNMLPLPPLDGSRVMYALAPEFVRRGMEVVERYGLMVVLVLVLVANQQLGMVMGVAIRAILAMFAALFGL